MAKRIAWMKASITKWARHHVPFPPRRDIYVYIYIYCILKEGLKLSRFASNFRFKLPFFLLSFSNKVSQGAESIGGADTSFQYERVPNKRFCWNLNKWVFPKIVYHQIIHFNRVFHYKPSILGYLYFWKHPNHWIKNLQSHDCRIFYVLWSSVASCYWCSWKNLLSHWVKWESFHFESSWTTGISGTGTAGTRPQAERKSVPFLSKGCPNVQ